MAKRCSAWPLLCLPCLDSRTEECWMSTCVYSMRDQLHWQIILRRLPFWEAGCLFFYARDGVAVMDAGLESIAGFFSLSLLKRGVTSLCFS
jgi:hypothetical protein